jgi:hypothetical protein
MENQTINNEFNFENELIRREIFVTMSTSDADHPVIIYNPNQEQRKMILDLIVNNLHTEDDKMTTKISGTDMVFKLLDELTNIHLELDMNNPEHQQRVQNIVSNPSDLFLDINNQLNKIVNKQFYRYYDNLKQLADMPQDLRDVYIESLDKIKVEDEQVEIELTEEEKRIIELEEELNKLKSKKEGV